jgi:hypothetical protein
MAAEQFAGLNDVGRFPAVYAVTGFRGWSCDEIDSAMGAFRDGTLRHS